MDKGIRLQMERHKTSIRIEDKWNPMGEIKQNMQGFFFFKVSTTESETSLEQLI